MRRLLLRWLINAAALFVAEYFVEGITAEGGWEVLLVVALIFGLLNAIIRPLLRLLTCPVVALTLGLFTLVINALMLLLTAWVALQLNVGFHVAGFVPAFWGGLVVTIVSVVLSILVNEKK